MIVNLTLCSIGVLLLAFFASIVFQNESKNVNLELKKNFLSNNALKWLENGQYFNYKNEYKIFYYFKKAPYDESVITNVFLHGFPTSSYDWFKIWSQFSSNEQLLTFDYIGYGFSDKPLAYNYSIFDMVDIFEALLIRLNIYNVNIIAHDIGDTVAQELIRKYEYDGRINGHYKINKVVLLNGGLLMDVYKPRLIQKLLQIDYLNDIFVKYFINYYAFKLSFSEIFGKLNRPKDEDLKDFFEILLYNNGHQALPKTINYLQERQEYGHVWYNALNDTLLPIALIYGPADPINPNDEYPKRIQSELINLKFFRLHDQIGHYPQWEDPFTVFDLIKKFLAN